MEFSAPKKSLGQNFLMHAATAERIVAASQLPQDAVVLEIGPGRGLLTKPLLVAAKKVIAVETDSELVEFLRTSFSQEITDGRLELVHGDIREYDLATLPNPYHVVANIPYYITGDIIRRLLESVRQPVSMTLLVQKEVAERIARDKKESILSLSIKAYGIPQYMFTVPKGAFIPAPKVDSAVLSIRDISRRHFASTEEEENFFRILKAGFAHKRKFLANNLAEIGISPAVCAPKARAEDLSLFEWLRLAKITPS